MALRLAVMTTLALIATLPACSGPDDETFSLNNPGPSVSATPGPDGSPSNGTHASPTPSPTGSPTSSPNTTPTSGAATGPTVAPFVGANLAVSPPAYNPNLPVWPTVWSPADVSAQRTAGDALVQNVGAALAAGQPNYTIATGVYRITQGLPIFNSNDFTLFGNGAEIIMESPQTAHMRILQNTNFTLTGPITLDGNSYGFTQGTIVGTDGSTYVDIELMSGYLPPDPNGLMFFFTPDGRLLRHFPDAPASATDMGNGVWRLGLHSWTFSSYPAQTQNVVVPGNLVVIDDTGGWRGGLELRENINVTMTDVNLYSFSLIWALPERGNDIFRRIHCTRRPGTNRLGGGGSFQMLFVGGSFTLQDSEVAYTRNDLVDVHGSLNYGWQQATSTSIYGGMPFGSSGQHVTFFDYNTLSPTGTAVLTGINTVSDANLVAAFNSALDARGILHQSSLVELVFDRSVDMNFFTIVEVDEQRPQFMTVSNSYLHDGLSAGLNLKGAQNTLVLNNVIERAAFRGVGVTYDPPWWEGGIPHVVTIARNTVSDTPYNLVSSGAAIAVAGLEMPPGALGTPVGGVTITQNRINNPQVEGIHVGGAHYVSITHNVINNPVADKAETGGGSPGIPYPTASVVSVDVVGLGTAVMDNTAIAVDGNVVPGFVYYSPLTTPAFVTESNNKILP